jgi:hypothetical protein
MVRWSKQQTALRSGALRMRIVLLAADGISNIEFADEVRCNQATALKRRKGSSNVVSTVYLIPRTRVGHVRSAAM